MQPQSPPGKPKEPESPPSISDAVFSVDPFYWLTRAEPKLRAGKNSTGSDLAFPGKSQYTPGVEVSIPTSRFNAIHVSYFNMRGGGDTVAPSGLNLFGTAYNQGDLLTAHYTLQSAKVSYDYLSYPFPHGATGFRVKTLWEVQTTWLKSNIDAPASTTASSTTAQGTQWFIYPTFGLELEHAVSDKFHWEAKGSGFGVPHHADTWEAEGAAAYRIGRFELRLGARAFHFKSSVRNDEYSIATLSGVFVDFGWRPNWW